MKVIRCWALLSLLFLMGEMPAFACSCLEILSEPKEALSKSGLVFSGRVVSIDVVHLPMVSYSEDERGELQPSQFMDRRGLVRFAVTKQWKGNPAEELYVLASAPPDPPLREGYVLVDCDVQFEIGKEYLVFTSEGITEANPCAPIELVEESGAVIRTLDRLVSKKRRH